MQLSASQGLPVPVIGYVLLEEAVLRKRFAEIGFLVVKDPVAIPINERQS